MRSIKAFIFLALTSCAGMANAATGNVIFNGSVAQTCTLNVIQNGVLAGSANLQSLSSHIGIGAPGQVDLITTGGVRLSVDPVTVSSGPVADTSATSWAPTYLTTGATTVAETGNATVISTPGDSRVYVHLVGTKAGRGYRAVGQRGGWCWWRFCWI